MPIHPWQRFLAVAALLFGAASAPARAPHSVLHWERIHTLNAAPSAVFAKLGLTHTTKNGLTRDGRKGVPDPTFPPGLTDVVPYDADHLLLVRGTAGGLTLFRARVSAADRSVPPVHLHAELARPGSDAPLLAAQDTGGVADGLPTQITLGDGGAARVYQITERANLDGTVWIACRVSLPLPDQSALAPTGPVFIPERIWTDPMSRKIRPGETAAFEDFGAARAAAAKKLGATGPDAGEDYVLRVTLTPE